MDLFEQLKKLNEEISAAAIQNAAELENFRIRYLGTKNLLKDLFAEIKNVPNEKRKDFGQQINEVKNLAEEKYEALKGQFDTKVVSEKSIDVSAPAFPLNRGSRHPIQIVKNEIIDIFSRMGFVLADGPEIDDDWHNFSALNMPKDHAARDMQDTFYINENVVLRTHTSNVQIHVMENQKPPIRILIPGRVYRNETISARAHCSFHQVEGLYIDEQVSFADLKQCLLFFAKEMFGQSVNIRMRPSYFPFTEPSTEVDVSCFICNAKGCNVCKHSGWVEILGAGMVDPAVMQNCKIDDTKYSGFAFGMGIERIAMLKYRINDIRLFWENDVRFLKQFESA